MNPSEYLWHVIHRGFDNLTPAQTATIGGAGTGVALASAGVMPDFTVLNSWFQMIALGTGALSGVLTVVFMGIKIRKSIKTPAADE